MWQEAGLMGLSLSLPVYMFHQQENELSAIGEFGIISAMNFLGRRDGALSELAEDQLLTTPPDSGPTTHLCLEGAAGSFAEDQFLKPRLRRIAPFRPSSQSVNTLRKVTSSLPSQKKLNNHPLYLRSVGSLNQLDEANAPIVVERCMTCCDLRAEYNQLKRTGKCVYQSPLDPPPESVSICLRCNTFIIQMEEF